MCVERRAAFECGSRARGGTTGASASDPRTTPCRALPPSSACSRAKPTHRRRRSVASSMSVRLPVAAPSPGFRGPRRAGSGQRAEEERRRTETCTETVKPQCEGSRWLRNYGCERLPPFPARRPRLCGFLVPRGCRGGSPDQHGRNPSGSGATPISGETLLEVRVAPGRGAVISRCRGRCALRDGWLPRDLRAIRASLADPGHGLRARGLRGRADYRSREHVERDQPVPHASAPRAPRT